MKTKIIIILFICLIAANITAQEAIIAQDDIDLFIESYSEIAEEFEDFNYELEYDGETNIIPDVISLEEDIIEILDQYGWDNESFEKFQLILQCLYFLSMEDEMLGSSPDIQEALEEIDAMPVSEYFTAEMKQNMRDMILMAVEGMNEIPDKIASADMDLVRENKEGLLEMLEDENYFEDED